MQKLSPNDSWAEAVPPNLCFFGLIWCPSTMPSEGARTVKSIQAMLPKTDPEFPFSLCAIYISFAYGENSAPTLPFLQVNKPSILLLYSFFFPQQGWNRHSSSSSRVQGAVSWGWRGELPPCPKGWSERCVTARRAGDPGAGPITPRELISPGQLLSTSQPHFSHLCHGQTRWKPPIKLRLIF